MYRRRYFTYGAVFGLFFPVFGTLVEAAVLSSRLGVSYGAGIWAAQKEPLLWIIWSAPAVLGLFASLAGIRQDALVSLDEARRVELARTAGDVFASAQALLSTVSSFSSMAAETAASVRETTATMGQLGQTATQAALTAETVIGVAKGSQRAAEEGVGAVTASTGEMAKLGEEVRGLSRTIDALNGKMRDVFEVASMVNYIADRSQRLAETAAGEAEKAGAGDGALQGVVTQMRQHADDAKRAAAQVKATLADVHKVMLGAMTAAEIGVRRAEQSAQVAGGTGDTIRRLAGALRETSEAARGIAQVAQQQDHGIDQVLKAMNEIYAAAQETMAATQQVAAQARSLHGLAVELKKQVDNGAAS